MDANERDREKTTTQTSAPKGISRRCGRKKGTHTRKPYSVKLQLQCQADVVVIMSLLNFGFAISTGLEWADSSAGGPASLEKDLDRELTLWFRAYVCIQSVCGS